MSNCKIEILNKKGESLISDSQSKKINENLDYKKYISIIRSLIDLVNKVYKNEYIVDFSKEVAKGLKDGTLRLQKDKFGNFLSQVCGKDGKIIEIGRIKSQDLFKTLGSCAFELATQIAIVYLISEVQGLQKMVYSIHQEMQNERLAKLEAALVSYNRALKINNENLKQLKLINLSNMVEESIQIMKYEINREKNYFDNKKYEKDILKLNPIEEAEKNAKEFFNSIYALTVSVETNMQIYNELSEDILAFNTIENFNEFIFDLNLNNKDELLKIYGHIGCNEEEEYKKHEKNINKLVSNFNKINSFIESNNNSEILIRTGELNGKTL